MNRFIDTKPSRCIACGTCQTACSEWHRRNGFQQEPRLTVVQNREVAAAVTCHHCEGAPCVKVCPTNAITQRDDGAIRVDEVHCVGCKMCAIACPFGAIHMSGTPRSGYAGIQYMTSTLPDSIDPILRWEIGFFPVAVKCDLCEYNDYHPKCVEACPTEALRLTEIEEDFINEKNRRAHRSLEAEVIMFENMDRAQDGHHRGLAALQLAAMEETARALERTNKAADDASADPRTSKGVSLADAPAENYPDGVAGSGVLDSTPDAPVSSATRLAPDQTMPDAAKAAYEPIEFVPGVPDSEQTPPKAAPTQPDAVTKAEHEASAEDGNVPDDGFVAPNTKRAPDDKDPDTQGHDASAE